MSCVRCQMLLNMLILKRNQGLKGLRIGGNEEEREEKRYMTVKYESLMKTIIASF